MEEAARATPWPAIREMLVPKGDKLLPYEPPRCDRYSREPAVEEREPDAPTVATWQENALGTVHSLLFKEASKD